MEELVNKPRIAALALILTVTCMMSSCATTHLWRWGLGHRSFVDEPKYDFSAAMLKPTCTVAFTPVTVAWDVLTLPYQLIFQVYPYFGQKHMSPSEVGD